MNAQKTSQRKFFLLETDDPYPSPVPHSCQHTEPSFVRHTAACIATARGETLESLTEHCGQATLRFFPKLHAKIASL